MTAWPRYLAYGAALVTALVALGYGLLVGQQDGQEPDVLRIPFVFAFLALLGTAALAGVRWPAWLGFAAGGQLGLGLVAIFSIGLPLLGAGLLASLALAGALAKEWRTGRLLRAGLGGAAAVAILIAGSEVVDRVILCPPGRYVSGSGYHLLTGGYHWECVNGELHYAAGFCSQGGGSSDTSGRGTSTSGC